ncbi:MAG: tetratricopeptide repeat protein [Myxococcaceae bacterium]
MTSALLLLVFLGADGGIEAAACRALAQRAGHEADPAKALVRAAVCYEEASQYGAAAKTWQRIADEYPKSTEADAAAFRVALDAEQRYDFEQALARYRLFLARYPRSQNAEVALFAIPRLLNALGRYAEAADANLAYAKQFPKSEEAAKSIYRAAIGYEKVGANEKEIAALREYLQVTVANPETELAIEAQGRIGDAYKRLGQRPESEKAFAAAADTFDRLQMSPNAQPIGAEAAARARFELAEFQSEDYAAMRLRSDSSKHFADDLAAMKEAVQRLQPAYDKVIPYKRAQWTLAAFYKKGAALELLAQRMKSAAAPCPGDCASDALAAQAARFFEGVLVEAEHQGIQNEWEQRCADDLRHLSPGSALAKAKPMPMLLSVGVPSEALDSAEREAHRQLDLDPTRVSALESLAEVGLLRQQIDLAWSLVEKALAIEPENGRLYFLLGQAQFASGRSTDAATSFKRAMDLDAKLVEAANNYGALLVDQRRGSEAVSVLERTVHTNPKWVAAHLNLGNAYRAAGDFIHARDEYRLAAALAPDRPEPWFNLGILLVDENISGTPERERLFEAMSALHKLEAIGWNNVVAAEYARIAERRLPSK